jgi:hypothetical protein
MFFLSCLGKSWEVTINYTIIASFHVLPNSLLTNVLPFDVLYSSLS